MMASRVAEISVEKSVDTGPAKTSPSKMSASMSHDLRSVVGTELLDYGLILI